MNVEATASLNSLLNTTSSPRKLSQADVSIPANLIPPKARAMANGNSSTSTTKKATTSPTSSTSQSLKPVQILKPNKQTQQKQPSSKQPAKKVEQQKPKPAESSPKGSNDQVESEQGGLVIKTAAHGIQCPIVTPEQMRLVEEICRKFDDKYRNEGFIDTDCYCRE